LGPGGPRAEHRRLAALPARRGGPHHVRHHLDPEIHRVAPQPGPPRHPGCRRRQSPEHPRLQGAQMMRMRRLGNSSLNASSIGLGLMSMSGTYGKSDDQECIGVIHRALDLGINHLDSSDMYGWGQNEELLGRAIKGKRDRVLVATKFGQVRSEYSLRYRQPPEDTIATCRELGISFIAYSPIGRGLLSARIKQAGDMPEDDRRRQHPRFQEGNLEHNLGLVRRIEEIAREKG